MAWVKSGQDLAFLAYLARHVGEQEIHGRQFLPTVAPHVHQNKNQGLCNDLQGPTLSAFLHPHVFLSLQTISLLIIHLTLVIPASMLFLTQVRYNPAWDSWTYCSSALNAFPPDVFRSLLKCYLLCEAFPDHRIYNCYFRTSWHSLSPYPALFFTLHLSPSDILWHTMYNLCVYIYVYI